VVINGLGTPIWIVETVLLISVVCIALYAYKLYKEDAEETSVA